MYEKDKLSMDSQRCINLDFFFHQTVLIQITYHELRSRCSNRDCTKNLSDNYTYRFSMEQNILHTFDWCHSGNEKIVMLRYSFCEVIFTLQSRRWKMFVSVFLVKWKQDLIILHRFGNLFWLITKGILLKITVQNGCNSKQYGKFLCWLSD